MNICFGTSIRQTQAECHDRLSSSICSKAVSSELYSSTASCHSSHFYLRNITITWSCSWLAHISLNQDRSIRTMCNSFECCLSSSFGFSPRSIRIGRTCSVFIAFTTLLTVSAAVVQVAITAHLTSKASSVGILDFIFHSILFYLSRDINWLNTFDSTSRYRDWKQHSCASRSVHRYRNTWFQFFVGQLSRWNTDGKESQVDWYPFKWRSHTYRSSPSSQWSHQADRVAADIEQQEHRTVSYVLRKFWSIVTTEISIDGYRWIPIDSPVKAKMKYWLSLILLFYLSWTRNSKWVSYVRSFVWHRRTTSSLTCVKFKWWTSAHIYMLISTGRMWHVETFSMVIWTLRIIISSSNQGRLSRR